MLDAVECLFQIPIIIFFLKGKLEFLGNLGCILAGAGPFAPGPFSVVFIWMTAATIDLEGSVLGRNSGLD